MGAVLATLGAFVVDIVTEAAIAAVGLIASAASYAASLAYTGALLGVGFLAEAVPAVLYALPALSNAVVPLGLAFGLYTFAGNPAIAGGFIFAGIALSGSIIAVSALQDSSDKSSLAPYDPQRTNPNPGQRPNIRSSGTGTDLAPYQPQPWWQRFGNTILGWLEAREELALQYELEQLKKNPATTPEEFYEYWERAGSKIKDYSIDSIIAISETVYSARDSVSTFYRRARGQPGGTPFTLTDLVYEYATSAKQKKARSAADPRSGTVKRRKKNESSGGEMGMCEYAGPSKLQMRLPSRSTSNRTVRSNASNRRNRRGGRKNARKLGKTTPRRGVGKSTRSMHRKGRK